MASSNEASDQLVQFLAEELVKFKMFQESLKSPFTPITAIAESGNPNMALSLRPPNGSLILEPQIT